MLFMRGCRGPNDPTGPPQYGRLTETSPKNKQTHTHTHTHTHTTHTHNREGIMAKARSWLRAWFYWRLKYWVEGTGLRFGVHGWVWVGLLWFTIRLHLINHRVRERERERERERKKE